MFLRLHKGLLKRSKHGFTLVELAVVLTILLIVLVIGYQLISFSQNTYNRGEMRYIAQENVRFACDIITREVRNANHVKILPSVPASLDTKKRYIFIQNGVLKHYLGNGVIVDALAGINEKAEFTNLEFSVNAMSINVLTFSVAAKSGSIDFESDSQVEVLNLPQGQSIDNTELLAASLSTGSVVCYSYSDNAKSLNLFSFRIEHNAGLKESFEIINPAFAFTCWLPMGTDKSSLVPYFEYTGKSITVNGTEQIPGVTKNDFTHPVVYKITAEDGSSVNYTVTVKEIDSQPEASGVKIKVINTGEPDNITPYENSTLHGEYNYIENGCGPEGASLFVWQTSTSEDFESPVNVAFTRDYEPKGKAGMWVRFGVKPVSQSGIPSSTYFYSNPKLIYPPIDDNPFWRSFINDLYVMGLPEEERPKNFESSVLFRTKYKAVSNLSPDNEDLNLTMSYDHTAPGVSDGGSHIYKDVKDYVTDMDSFSITVDAQVQSGSGYGVLFYGDLRNNQSQNDYNIDSGYMFQFDPGWNGLLIRKIENGQHNPWYRSFGVLKEKTESQINDIQGFYLEYGKYSPQDIRNSLFRWPTDKTSQDLPEWQKRYKTEIVIQRQLDNSIIFKVTLIDQNNNRSNEMWFGDFSPYEMEVYRANGKKENSSVSFNPRSLPQFTSKPGTMLGLRTWDKSSSAFKTLFQEIKLGEGFSMNIEKAEFTGSRQIRVKMDQEIRSNIDLNRVSIKGYSIQNARVISLQDKSQELLIDLKDSVAKSALTDGLSGGMTINRGGIRHLMAGDVKIANGNGFKIEKDKTPPEITAISRDNSSKSVTLTFSEEIDGGSILNKSQYLIRKNNNSQAYSPGSVSLGSDKKTITLIFSSLNENTFKGLNRISVSNIKDIAGNAMNQVTNMSF